MQRNFLIFTILVLLGACQSDVISSDSALPTDKEPKETIDVENLSACSIMKNGDWHIMPHADGNRTIHGELWMPTGLGDKNHMGPAGRGRHFGAANETPEGIVTQVITEAVVFTSVPEGIDDVIVRCAVN